MCSSPASTFARSVGGWDSDGPLAALGSCRSRISLRGGRLRVEVQLRGVRLKGAPSPQVHIKANGVTIFETLASNVLESYRFGLTLPETRLELAIESDTFRPADFGPLEDRRSLGVQVHYVVAKCPTFDPRPRRRERTLKKVAKRPGHLVGRQRPASTCFTTRDTGACSRSKRNACSRS
jgi:hypothetical protein